MSFQSPWLLLLLLLVPAALYIRYAPSRRGSVLFSSAEALTRLPASWRVRTRNIPPILFAGALVLMVVALARPRDGLEESRIRADVVDIVLLVDVSTSMRAEDFSTPGRRRNRLDAAKEVIESFVRRRTNDRISMVAFAALPYTVSPLTLDHDWLLESLDRVQIGMLEDGTAIGTALASAVNRLRDSQASAKVVVLLTDGVNNAGSLTPENAALAAEALDITVYTIGAASSDPADRRLGLLNIRRRVEIDEETLRTIAETTGGQYFRAEDFNELASVYREIDALERTEVEVEEFKRYEERFTAFLIPGLLLLLIEQILSLTVYRRVYA